MATVSLSSGVRAALTSLDSTKTTAQESQYRLATGKKVNSAVDNPVNFFTAQGLNARAGQLTDLLDGISNGIQTITAASQGIDSITKLVNSLQSTIKQAQNDAATNRPKIASDVALATTAEATDTNKSIKDVSLNKVVLGTQADADATTAGNVGVGATAGNVVQLSAGSTTYQFTIAAGSTVRDVVNQINKSGIATAAVDTSGKLSVTGSGSDALTVELGAGTGASFTADGTETAKLFGAADTTDVASSTTSGVRTSLVQQFNDLRDQIDQLAKDAGFNGINLLAGDKLSITFNEKTGNDKNKLDVQGEQLSSDALGIGEAVDGTATGTQFSIQNDTDLSKMADALTNSLSSLRTTSSSLGAQLSVVQTRQDFTKNLVNTLTQGADNLVLADTNEEGAKLLALQTRQQLSQTALSLSNQADQAVLRLF